MAFPLDVLGDEWAEWVRTTADAASCPVDYVVAPLLATASALIGNSRWVQAGAAWKEPPTLWVASIGDSGSGKSPGGDAIFGEIVPELERRMAREFPDQHRQWSSTAEILKARKEQWEDDVATAVKKGLPPPNKPDDADPGPEPQKPRLRQSDVTVEKVALLLAQSAPKGLLMARDELAAFLMGMNQYSETGRQFWLETFGGRPHRVERVKHPEPIDVPRMTCSWFGTIQPSRLASLLKGEVDDGLMARFIFFWPDPVDFDLATTPPDTEQATKMLDRLRELEMEANPAPGGGLRPKLVPLAAEAQPLLIRFARAVTKRQKDSVGLLNSAYAKGRGLVMRLSLVIEFLRWAAKDCDPFNAGPPTVISLNTFHAALRLVTDYLLPMAERTYADAETPRGDDEVATLAKWIVQTTPRPTEIHVRNMQRKVRLAGLRQADRIHAACKELIAAGWLLPCSPIGGMNRARASYPINPALWEAWNARV